MTKRSAVSSTIRSTLPAGWVTMYEEQEDGTLLEKRGLPPLGCCERCREPGHNMFEWEKSATYAKLICRLYAPPCFKRDEKAYQCSSCRRFGHNSRGCPGPVSVVIYH